jgi:prepilin-type N-terminal cleavage/methylation domain-containing protein
MATKQTQTGVTLMELMVVVAIAAILATVAAPSFSDFINNTKQSSTVTQLVSDLNRARSEAIKRNSRILFCKSNSATAPTDCINGSQYHTNGWLICYDTDANGICDTSTTALPNPIAVHQAFTNMTLVLTRADATTVPVRFNPNGTQGTAAATFTLTGTWAGATAKIVNIAATGYISKQ